MKIFDTNYVLRSIIMDVPDEGRTALNILNHNKVYVPNEVLAEAVFVMSRFYNIDRNEIFAVMTDFLNIRNIVVDNKDTLLKAFAYFSSTSLDFVDCLMYAYRVVEGYEVCTFDKKLNRLIKRETEE